MHCVLLFRRFAWLQQSTSTSSACYYFYYLNALSSSNNLHQHCLLLCGRFVWFKATVCTLAGGKVLNVNATIYKHLMISRDDSNRHTRVFRIIWINRFRLKCGEINMGIIIIGNLLISEEKKRRSMGPLFVPRWRITLAVRTIYESALYL